jgi:NADH:ubiquinone oxidoreductase subunit 3 (subunit A)
MAIVIFALIAIFVPLSMVLTSIMLRKPERSNPVSSSPFESGEQSSGARISLMNEYLHYFPMFLSLEVIIGIILIWALVARSISFKTGLIILALPVLGMLFTNFIMLFARSER